MSRHPSRRRAAAAGFTLLELLVVVAVIGILAVIGIPSMRRALLRARIGRMASDATTLHKAMVTYAIDHDVYPANGTGPGDPFDRVTLEPLVSQHYLHNYQAVTAKPLARQLPASAPPDGRTADAEGHPAPRSGVETIASNGHLHDAILTLLERLSR